MTWTAIARNDLRGALSRRGIWGLVAGFLLGFVGLAVLLIEVDAAEFEAYVDLLAPGVGVLVPLAGIVLGYESVVGERESGTAVLALSMPHSRTALAAGKLLSRTTLLAGAVAIASLVTGVVMAVTFTGFDALRYVAVLAGTLAYGVVFLWLAAGLSMVLSSARRVIAAAFGAYIALALSWTLLVDIVVVILFRFQATALADPPTWAEFASFVGPRTAFSYLLGHSLDAGRIPAVATQSSAGFVTPGVAVLALAAWAIMPVLAGYAAFRRTDL